MALPQRIISGDTHLEVPAERWTCRVPAAYRDRAPRTVRLANGADGFLIEGSPVRENAFDLYGGKGRDRWGPFGQTYEETPGTASPEDRLACLDLDGSDAEIIFPPVVTGPRAWRNIRDDAPYLAVVRAYNDFVAEEYAGYAPTRFYPMGVIPMAGVPRAIDELRHCAGLGLKGVMLSAFPSGLGSPGDEDDAFWEEALALRMALTIHVDLDRSGPRAGPLVHYPKRAGMADLAGQVARFAQRGALNAVQLMIAGVFDRFPTLRIFMAENQIGWVPTFMTVADERYDRHLHWARELLGFEGLKNGHPSDYIRRHVLWGFQRDPAGVELRHWMGVDHLIWGSDFPHQESEYPHSHKVIEQNFGRVSEEDRAKMLSLNATRFFGLD
ncbi:MAG: amidohydrolase [Acidimicrobiales bacterium]|nr:amidohydrolase [Acidimicrobiales bacterium]MBO0893780.1 amidohydrolase [Acidimicrobiales bacterium]